MALKEVGVTFIKVDDNTVFYGTEFRDGVLSDEYLKMYIL